MGSPATESLPIGVSSPGRGCGVCQWGHPLSPTTWLETHRAPGMVWARTESPVPLQRTAPSELVFFIQKPLFFFRRDKAHEIKLPSGSTGWGVRPGDNGPKGVRVLCRGRQ